LSLNTGIFTCTGKKYSGSIKENNAKIQKLEKDKLLKQKEYNEAMALKAYYAAKDYLKEKNFQKAYINLKTGKSLAPYLKNWDKEIDKVQEAEAVAYVKIISAKILKMNEYTRKGIAALAVEKPADAVDNLSLALKLAKELNRRSDLQIISAHLKNAKELLKKRSRRNE
jgi:hypothetical protein